MRRSWAFTDTEIDWSTYMEQVQAFLNGALNYEDIKGATGPIVYPAGHLYIYTLLYYLTNRGQNIILAQYIFAILYLVTLMLVFRIYLKADTKVRYLIFNIIIAAIILSQKMNDIA
jgi:alpha-1,3-mannosyltransferase